ncbi:isoafricanol synthase [Streptomyces sp. H27-D2]|uniref:isoafricanol synthase n=1 Tax=Streptomyces sp. H27-D2 TaxID=3046304 RepID=UPI002DBB58D2|nr:isoafricanol synthase [Streptomyces sp. H27-D2]MEC4018516.1 isoafricanol synthase [Streptomyces sp. H27-D2]
MTEPTGFGSPRPGSNLAERTARIDIRAPLGISPDTEAARRHTLRWLHELGMLRGESATAEYDVLRLERLMAYFYPEARGADLELATDLNGWFFLFDDQFDGDLGLRPEAVAVLVDAIVRTMYDVPEVPPRAGESPGPLLVGYRDLWRRIADGTPLAWQHRFRDHWREYLDAYHWESLNRTRRGPLSLEQFLRGRRDSIGVQPCLDLTERAGRYTIPRELHTGSPLAEMREITADVVIFVNDIVSLDKELAAGDVNNSVIILHRSEDCTVGQAVRRVVRATNDRIGRFQRLAEELPGSLADSGVPATLRDHVEHYVDGMRHVMRGNLAWSLETARYDARGIAAVSEGRQRPWAGLFNQSSAPAS